MLTSAFFEKKIYSVSELNRETKDLLSDHFFNIQVEGEISNLSTPASGHIYFSLKDKKAQIRCAMFKMQQRQLTFKPTNGQQVIISAQVSLYEVRGDYQLIADNMQEEGAGDLQVAFEQLKNKLQNEGLFDTRLKQDIPHIPSHIGIITSPTGAAIHDILSVLKRRFPAIPVTIYPTTVQGNTAKSEISTAIQTANQLKQVDVIILSRGGGSIEDLWAFNEECVARAMSKSKIPIISGIGHDVDFTIADFVADLRAPTPSVAAENAVPNHMAWLSAFQSIEAQLAKIIQAKLSNHQQSIDWVNRRLQQQHLGKKVQHHSESLKLLNVRLSRTITNTLQHQKYAVNTQITRLQQCNPRIQMIRKKERLCYINSQLKNAMQQGIEKSQRQFLPLVQTLHAVSPLATLNRGYAIITDSKTSEIISSTQQLSINDSINIRLAHGELSSHITDIKHD
jgi:exodeoxyribonuclease VII large subunit